LPDRGSHVANASFMVDPRWQDRGVGRKLAQHCLHEAWARGYLAMQFNFVVSTNTRAVRLWESLGFNIVGTLPKVFRHRQLGDVDAYVMFRPLEKVPDSSEEVPSFGTVDTSLPYVVRPSAYALFRNAHGDLAAVRTSRGVCLPGGALDPGESPEQAAVREVAEECAISVEAGARVCYAVSIQNAPIDQVCYEKRNTFLEARLIEPLATTPHHELVWLPLKHAAERLTSKSHAWAVTRYTI
jgi:8-oxo-dGTP pyrophosphatase MutT (NUDIX family)